MVIGETLDCTAKADCLAIVPHARMSGIVIQEPAKAILRRRTVRTNHTRRIYRSGGRLHFAATEQRILAQSAVPFRQVLKRRVDATITESRRCWALIRLFPSSVLECMSEGAVRDVIVASNIGDSVCHLERRKNSLAQKLGKRLSRDCFHNSSEQDIARIAVLPLCSRREFRIVLML